MVDTDSAQLSGSSRHSLSAVTLAPGSRIPEQA